MNEEDIRVFLGRPLAAVIGTVSPSGAPHSVPVWFRYDGSAFIVWTHSSRAWVRNVRRRPDVSVVVAAHEAPGAAVVASGTAEVTSDEDAVDEEIRLIARRYLPEEAVKDYIARWPDLRTIVRITPGKLRSWSESW